MRLIPRSSLTSVSAHSYQTPNGVVSGIQWVPADATQILPANAIPANLVSPDPMIDFGY